MNTYRTMNEYTIGNSVRSAAIALLKMLIDAQVEYPEPDWEPLPVWANWWAIDNVGRICWFETQPSCSFMTGWSCECRCGRSRIGNDLPLGCDWRLTLRQRPSQQ